MDKSKYDPVVILELTIIPTIIVVFVMGLLVFGVFSTIKRFNSEKKVEQRQTEVKKR